MSLDMSMPDYHRRYVMWMQLLHNLELEYTAHNDETTLARLKLVRSWIEEAREEKVLYDEQNYKKLLQRLDRELDYPESIRFWIEDEGKDLLG